MFSSYGRRSRSNCWSVYKCCQPNIFWLLCFKAARLGTVDAPSEGMTPIPFQIMCSKIKVKLLIFILSVVLSYDFLIDGYQTLLQCLTSVRRLSLLLFGSQGQGQTTGLHLSIVHSLFYEPYA